MLLWMYGESDKINILKSGRARLSCAKLQFVPVPAGIFWEIPFEWRVLLLKEGYSQGTLAFPEKIIIRRIGIGLCW